MKVSVLQQASLSNDDYGAKPAQDEIEVTVIGPGFGETILVHVGEGKWFIVDSCASSTSSEPESLRYLKEIGVSPESVFAVFVTHWDDDHCKGMAKVVSACSNAKVVMSKAFVEKDFLAYTTAVSKPLTMKVRAGPKEILGVVGEMSEKKRTIVGASAERRIFNASGLGLEGGIETEIWTFSPSDEEYENFLLWVAEQMPKPDETRRVAVKRIRNDLSVVIYVRIGSDVILLGGDLEEEGKAATGWSAILALQGKPEAKAHVFKVPHHGSQTGHHEGMAKALLTDEVIAIVAPFKNGSVSLPDSKDVERICGFSKEAHATASLRSRSSTKHDRTVQKTIDEVTRRFTTPREDPGMVRLRKKIGNGQAWQKEYFGSATSLSEIL